MQAPSRPQSRHRRRRPSLAALVLAALALSACGPEDDPVMPTSEPVAADLIPGSDLAELLQVTLEDEYRAEAIYQGVMKDFGAVLPFRNIAKAERQHALNILRLYASRGLTPPANPWNPDNVPHFTSVRAACQAGVQAELENIALYDHYLAKALPVDVALALTRNRRASLQAHLPAFKRCS